MPKPYVKDPSTDDANWLCPKCGNVNYSFRTSCNMRKCGAPKPENAVTVSPSNIICQKIVSPISSNLKTSCSEKKTYKLFDKFDGLSTIIKNSTSSSTPTLNHSNEHRYHDQINEIYSIPPQSPININNNPNNNMINNNMVNNNMINSNMINSNMINNNMVNNNMVNNNMVNNNMMNNNMMNNNVYNIVDTNSSTVYPSTLYISTSHIQSQIPNNPVRISTQIAQPTTILTGQIPNRTTPIHLSSPQTPQDWLCSQCGNINYGFRIQCNMRKCRAYKYTQTPPKYVPIYVPVLCNMYGNNSNNNSQNFTNNNQCYNRIDEQNLNNINQLNSVSVNEIGGINMNNINNVNLNNTNNVDNINSVNEMNMNNINLHNLNNNYPYQAIYPTH